MNTADDPVEGLVGYPLGRNFSFANVRVACTTLVDALQISPEKPLQGLVLKNITGTCTKGISLANIVGAELKEIKVTGFTGPLTTVKNVTGKGFEAPPAIKPAGN